MNKIIVISLIVTSIFAKNLTYKVTAPLFGEVGKVEVKYYSGKNYDIRANMQTYGFAKKLSGNRIESYHAKGSVKNNRYYAHSFLQKANYKNKKSYLEYSFDYKRKKILKTRKKWIDGKVKSNYTKPLNYFTYNDLFSAYHNIVAQLKNRSAGAYKMKVAGLEKYGGELLITIPNSKKMKKEAKSMGVKGAWIFHIVTNKKILGSKKGEVIFAVDNSGIATAVRVLDIPFVSHLDAKLVR